MPFSFLSPRSSSPNAGQSAEKKKSGGTSWLETIASKGYDAASAALAPKEHKISDSGTVGPAGVHVNMPLARSVARDLIAAGQEELNSLTDQVFYRLFPALNGKKLAGGSPEAYAWMLVMDQAVRPEIHAAKVKPGPSPLTPVSPVGPDVGPQEFHGTGDESGTGDAYLTQNSNSYLDDVENWSSGKASGSTCNMTSVAMALVSIAGSEDIARQAVAAFLRKKGLRSGASVKAGGKRVALKSALGDASLLAKVQLEDLCIAAGVALGGNFKAVTMTGTMLSVAKQSGLVTGGKAYGHSEKMADPEVYARAKALLAEGKRVIVGTVKHYVYLTAVRDDGILVHDPAGARVTVAGSPKYLWPGTAASKLGHWDGGLRSEALRRVALRRVSHNPKVRACFEQEAAALDLTGADRKSAREQVKKDHPGTLDTGANNFYGLDELTEYNCRIRVILEPNEAASGAAKEAS